MEGAKAAASGVAGLLRGDGAAQAELAPVRGTELIFRRHAEIGVQMPHSDAKRDAGVELVFGGALGHGVHGADKFVASCSFSVEQGSGACGIKRESFQEAVPIIREVIFGLREIGEKDFVTVVQGDVVVLVFFDAGAELGDDFARARKILRRLRARPRHVQVQVMHVHVPPRHVVHSAGFIRLGVIHFHPGHAAVFHPLLCVMRLGGGGSLRFLCLHGGGAVAGHGGK